METMVSLTGLIPFVGPILNAHGQRQDRKNAANQAELDRQRDRERNQRNREHQDKINAENRAEAERIRLINAQREDSQIQRQVADGRLAGLSPLAAMGNAGYTPAISSINQSSPETNQSLSRYSPIRGKSGAGLAGEAIQSILQQQGMNQNILESRSRTLLNEANAAKIANEQNNPMPPQFASDGRRIEHSTIIMKTRDGKEIVMPNNDLMEGLTPKEIAMFNAMAAGSRAIEPGSLPYRAWQNFNKYLKKHGGALTGRRR
ncbi:MAG: DNA pilot protein [Microviridae sp.]|nr:MAG: DNA pilot protein [Microviridae sp.]